jgi:hypothetical protein
MKKKLRNNDKSQFFCDTTYKCVPPTLKKYKLFVISSFDFIDKRIYILAICLIPKEKQITYEHIFDKLKNLFLFKPLIITSDFSRSITNAIKKIYPDAIQIKCLFHFLQAVTKKMKKIGLFKKDYSKEAYELLFNIKILAFINPLKIKNFYNKLIAKYNDEDKFAEFFNYFNKYWNPLGKKNIKFKPIWNYYLIMNELDFDKKHLFFTNNISEAINHNFNSKFKNRYPSFQDWKKTIINELERYLIKNDTVERKEYVTKIIIYIFKYTNFLNNRLSIIKKMILIN